MEVRSIVVIYITRSQENLSDSRTKLKANSALLNHMNSGKFKHSAKQ